MKTVPRIFFDHPAIETLFMDGNAAVFFKKVQAPSERNERFVSAHAITLVLSGQLKVDDSDGNFVLVEAGGMVFLPKGIYFVSDFLPEDGSFEALVFFFPDQMLEEWAVEDAPSSPSTSASKLPFKFPCPDLITRFSESLLAIYQPPQHKNYPLTLPKLSEFLHLIGHSPAGPALRKKIRSLAHREKPNLLNFMQSNFSKPLGVDDYAYLTGRSISTFQREFKRLFGQSPKQWLIERRLEKASGLLGQAGGTGSSISEVAIEVGYEDMSHFSKAFRRQYGLSPKQFAMQQRNSLGI